MSKDELSKDEVRVLISNYCGTWVANMTKVIDASNETFKCKYFAVLKEMQRIHSTVTTSHNPFTTKFDTTNSTRVFVHVMSVDHEKENPYYQYINGILDEIHTSVKEIDAEYSFMLDECDDVYDLLGKFQTALFDVEHRILYQLYTTQTSVMNEGVYWLRKRINDSYTSYWKSRLGIRVNKNKFIDFKDLNYKIMSEMRI